MDLYQLRLPLLKSKRTSIYSILIESHYLRPHALLNLISCFMFCEQNWTNYNNNGKCDSYWPKLMIFIQYIFILNCIIIFYSNYKEKAVKKFLIKYPFFSVHISISTHWWVSDTRFLIPKSITKVKGSVKRKINRIYFNTQRKFIYFDYFIHIWPLLHIDLL